MRDYDVIVIGSGAGGLTAAVALARSGKKVLVLEQHYVPGGWCHSFMLGGYRFSPGVHYIGELTPGGRMRAIFEGLGLADDLAFLEINPDGYDHILIGGERFDIPKGRDKYLERLQGRFPRERKALHRYFRTVDRLVAGLGDDEFGGFLQMLTLPFRSLTLARKGMRTLGQEIEAHFDDPMLRAILSIQAGDHGMPPSRAPFPLHAAVMAHYYGGGYYPHGGAYVIPRAYVRALRRAGGEIRLRTPVERILVEKGRVLGVRLPDGREIRADAVVSNADPHATFAKMVGLEHVSPALRARLAKTRYSCSALSLFFAVDMDLRAAGLDSGNYWYSATPDIEAGYTLRDLDVEEFPGQFLTVTTLKDPSKQHKGRHTLESFAFVPTKAFERWAGSSFDERPEEYRRLKSVLIERMLQGAERIVPGIRRRVVFADLGTPLTNIHYLNATEGNIYGTEKSRGQIGPFAYRVKSEIEGLYLVGASTLSHGVLGAAMSGLVGAARVLGCRTKELLRPTGSRLRIYPSDDMTAWPESMRPRKGEPVHA